MKKIKAIQRGLQADHFDTVILKKRGTLHLTPVKNIVKCANTDADRIPRVLVFDAVISTFMNSKKVSSLEVSVIIRLPRG